MDGSLRIYTSITMSEYLNLLQYKQAYLNLSEGNRICRDFDIEKQAIEKLQFLRPYKLVEMERMEYNK